MASARRVGAETSKTRDHLLDCVERLMADEGYAAVTYRAVAARAGVTGGLVQYYFPALDDVFIAAIRRRSEQNLRRLTTMLADRPNETLRVLWEYSREESTAALTTEFLALGNHRKSIRAVIAEVTEEVRRVQLGALRAQLGDDAGALQLSTEALLFLLTGSPKLMRLEEGVGVTTTHADALAALEQYLDAMEPRGPAQSSRRAKTVTKRSPRRRAGR